MLITEYYHVNQRILSSQSWIKYLKLRSSLFIGTPRVSRCPVCKKVFASKKEMRVHYSVMHLGETPSKEEASEPPLSMVEQNSFMMQAEAAGIPVVEPVPEEDISVPEEPYDPENSDEAYHVSVITESEERLIKENADFIKVCMD